MDFRPVKEIWGEHISSSASVMVVLDLLRHIAVETQCQLEGPVLYGDMFSLWIQDGQRYLNVLRGSFTVPDGMELTDALQDLVANLHSAADRWKSSLGSDGSLRIYIDLC